MNRTKLLYTALAILLVMNLGTLGFLLFHRAEDEGCRNRNRKQSGRLLPETLRFDEGQEAAFIRLKNRHQEKVESLCITSDSLRRTLFLMLRNPRPDTLAASAIIDSISNLKATILMLNFNHFRDIRSICRPDQITDYNQFIEDLSRRLRRPGQGQPGMGPPGMGPMLHE